MSRRRRPVKREVLPDPIFGDILITKFINCMMQEGKKSASEKIFYGALDIVTQKVPGEDSITVFKRALDNIKPQVEVKTRRVGGSNYQIPVEVRPERKQALAIRWLISYSRLRNEKSMRDKLAAEIVDAANRRGAAVKKREDIHKMAEANKAFAHYRL
jgi:small subunit ribosomal protein S7